MSKELLSKNYPHTFNILNELLFPEQYSEYYVSIATLTKSIYSGLPENFYHHFQEIELILSWLYEKQSGGLPSCDLFPRIRKDKLIHQNYIVTCVICELYGDAIIHDQDTFECYKYLLIAIAIKLTLLGLRSHYVRGDCFEVRMFAGGQRQNLSSLSPVIEKQKLEELKEQLVDARLKVAKDTESMLCSQLAHYIRLLELLLLNKNEKKETF